MTTEGPADISSSLGGRKAPATGRPPANPSTNASTTSKSNTKPDPTNNKSSSDTDTPKKIYTSTPTKSPVKTLSIDIKQIPKPALTPAQKMLGLPAGTVSI
jgi:hypothetical protein